MKKNIILLLLACSSLLLNAQMNWNIKYQKKDLLKNVSEDAAKNLVTITKASLKKSGSFTIAFNKPDTSNTYTLMVDDDNRSGIKSWDNVTKSVAITTAELKTLLLNRGKIHFYYTAIPKDPAKAAIVRMRPIHVCTLLLK
jgi:hypothetical protein